MLIERLDSAACNLSRAGGKGANLSLLIRSGFPVPGGFVVLTDAYRRFIEAVALVDWIPKQVESIRVDDPAALDAASAAIRERFGAAGMPREIADAARDAYADLGRPGVAVRSSATTEDLPELSFAGQQDTFLNVVSEQALLDAIVRCWSSLWTARAIGYRSRHRIGHDGLAIAVVVQQMVRSESSGVLFTANPLSGKRTEVVVEATLGLGEALVSGRVEPDRYTIVMPAERVVEKTLGSKRVSLRPAPDGGLAEHAEDAGARQALHDDTIVELARFGARAAEQLRAPQDIEWAFAGGQLWLLQSRPITSLYPLPEGVPSEPRQVFISVGAVQGMLDPFTPLGQDVLRVSLGGAFLRHFGQRESSAGTRIVVAGERLFLNATPLLRHAFMRGRIRAGLRLVEPGTHALLDRVLGELAPAPFDMSWLSLWRVFRVLIRIPFNTALNLMRPASRRARMLRRADDTVAAAEAERSSVATLADAVALLDRAIEMIPRVLAPYLASGVAAGIGMLIVLGALARRTKDGDRLVLEATRGLPHNVTTEMDLALWRAAQDRSGRGLDHFLVRYGMRGVGEIDIGRPRWRDDRSQLLRTIESYQKLPADQSPDAVFARGAASAEAALAQLDAALRQGAGGWWRAPLARWVGGRMRVLAGLRETPKFFAIRVMAVIREALLAAGGPDVFFLRLEELRARAAGDQSDLSVRIAERRAVYEREMRRRRVPRILLSNGEAFYGDEIKAAEGGEGVLTGSGVSPGVIDGIARIVFDPHAAQLAPGEILVCRGTDPAWTPFFLTAGGLVTEVGGLLTHGSVVAREYGIPAVVGVPHATTRLVDGQRVRVDGFSGRVTVLS
jgi:pyruvate,water dikinase